MKLFYFLYLFFCFHLVSAQLNVTPSAAGSSFLYVKNLVLYVEQDIHLDKNPNPVKEASIYLRNEAQLIQGNKNSNSNSGSGLISVFQEGSANAYNYNYWGLPVQDNSTGIKTAAKVIFEPIDKTESQPAILTSKLEGNANPLTISNWWLYKFVGGTYANWEYLGDNFDLDPGLGFTMKGVNGTNLTSVEGVPTNPGSQQRYDFRGKPNDGEISLAIEKDQVLLAGNPYPSAIDLNAFLVENTASTGIAYFWDHSNNSYSHYLAEYQGGYGAYSPGAGAYVPAVFQYYDEAAAPTGNTGETGKVYGREFSPVAQGFMIMGKTKGQIKFRNSQRIFMRETIGKSEFRRQEQLIPKLRLNISFDDLYVRQLLLAFRDDATTGIDHAMDAKSFGSLETDVAWSIEDEPYLINVMPFEAEKLIPFIISAKENTEVKIAIEMPENFSPEDIFLYDAEEEVYHKFYESDVTIQLEAGNYENRFYLTFAKESFKEPVLSNEEEYDSEPVENTGIVYNRSLRKVEIMAGDMLEEIQVFDLTGGLIFSKKIYENKQYDYFYTGNFREAVYIVKVKTRDNRITNKKLLLKK